MATKTTKVSINPGRTTLALADGDDLDLGPAARKAIRDALAPIVKDLRDGLKFISLALDAPDPEFALYEFVQFVKEMPIHVERLEQQLAKNAPAPWTRRAA